MNDIVLTSQQLPEKIEDLARFALVGREKLAAVRAEINAIRKVGLAKEVLEQKRAEGQEIAELVTLSEVRIGKMLKEIPKSSGGDRRSDDFKNCPHDNFEKSKSEAIKDLGFTPKQTHQFQQMAEHEDLVHEAIAEARENEEIISRSAVLRKIDEVKKPHVSFNSGNNEWYTPTEYIEAARVAMGTIDLDPATSEIANKVVKAENYYTIETDGLSQTWHGNVWLNPPYSSDMIGKFADKLISERKNYNQATILVNNATETEWFYKLVSIADAICFPKGRVKFYKPNGETGAPLQGQAVVYVGDREQEFLDAFRDIGWGCIVVGIYE